MFLRIKSVIAIAILFAAIHTQAQTNKNWNSKQLMEPSELASLLSAKKTLPLIISVGPGAYIAHSVSIGPVDNADGVEKLKKELGNHTTETKIVLYCGCCPFEHCPNVRPAIEALKAMHFTNYYLLNLSTNIKTDWINKGYPVMKL